MNQKKGFLASLALAAVIGFVAVAVQAAPIAPKAAVKKIVAVAKPAAVKKITVVAKPLAVKKAVPAKPATVAKKPVVAAKAAVAGKKIVAAAKPAVAPIKVSEAQAKTIATDFIKKALLTDGTAFEIKAINNVHGIYEMEIGIGSNKATSALTEDGKVFYPTSLVIADVLAEQAKAPATAATASTPAAQPAAVATKSDKPVVELFVMSYCPFGTQMEKGIIPAVQALGDKIDFQLKFVDYAMHGPKELTENTTQYCIDKEQHALLLPYVNCFVTSNGGESAKCLAEAKVDTVKLAACTAATDKQYEITATFDKGQAAWGSSFPPYNVYKADNTKYSVGGSPTLIINGAESSGSRDSQSLLASICSAFNTKPAECSTVLSSVSPSSGFGAAPAGNGTPAATCGS